MKGNLAILGEILIEFQGKRAFFSSRAFEVIYILIEFYSQFPCKLQMETNYNSIKFPIQDCTYTQKHYIITGCISPNAFYGSMSATMSYIY